MSRHVSMKSRSRYRRISSAVCALGALTTVVDIGGSPRNLVRGDGGLQATLHRIVRSQVEEHDVAVDGAGLDGVRLRYGRVAALVGVGQPGVEVAPQRVAQSDVGHQGVEAGAG